MSDLGRKQTVGSASKPDGTCTNLYLNPPVSFVPYTSNGKKRLFSAISIENGESTKPDTCQAWPWGLLPTRLSTDLTCAADQGPPRGAVIPCAASAVASC